MFSLKATSHVHRFPQWDTMMAISDGRNELVPCKLKQAPRGRAHLIGARLSINPCGLCLGIIAESSNSEFGVFLTPSREAYLHDLLFLLYLSLFITW